MAFFDQTYFKSAAPRPVGVLRRIFDTPFDDRARRIRARIAELRALSDEELRACGIARSEILRHALLTTRR